MSNDIFILTWVYCGKVTPLKIGTVELVQQEKKRLSKGPNYKKGKLQIRTKEGLKHKAIL